MWAEREQQTVYIRRTAVLRIVIVRVSCVLYIVYLYYHKDNEQFDIGIMYNELETMITVFFNALYQHF